MATSTPFGDHGAVVELSVLIPTMNRCRVLARSLELFAAQAHEATIEVIVADSASADATEEMVAGLARSYPAPLRFVQGNRPDSLAATRNRVLEAATGDAVLLLNDDSWPCPGLVAGHADFHRRHPETEAALLGRVRDSTVIAPTPFMKWAESSGLRFGLPEGPRDGDLGGAHFLTINVSAKARLIREAGGFDESFTVGCEDVELGFRLEQLGMRLSYDPDLLVDHFHPAGLATTIKQLRRYGGGARRASELHPERAPAPRPPGVRHRIKAAGLLALNLARIQPPAIRHETWRFLCHEAHREGFWEGPNEARPLRIGTALANVASRDPQARTPLAAFPGDGDRA